MITAHKLSYSIDYMSALELGFGHYISCGSQWTTGNNLARFGMLDNVLCLEVGSLPIHTAAFMQLFTWELYMNLRILQVLTQLNMHTKITV